MKKSFILLVAILFLNSFKSTANIGDTVVVQTFSFGSNQDAWFVFPSDTMRCEKVLMKYTLKCNPAQTPACGEWDYLTYTYLYDPTGLQDSTLTHQPVYTVNGATPDSIMYMNSASYSYHPFWQYSIVHTATTSLTTSTVGSGNLNTNDPFRASQPVSRTQYLWKASEIIASGMTAGNITGLQFYVQSIGGSMDNMKIKIKPTSLDSLTQSTLNNSGFTSVYSQNTQFNTIGWNSLQLTTPFNWDGIANLLIEITYDNAQPAVNNVVVASNTTFNSAVTTSGNDRVASFHNYGYINVPLNNKLAVIDSFVTVAFWCYGSPALQPMDGTAFEAVDSTGNRLLNSHLPWSDGNVYWDAGYGGTSYDRMSKAATAIQIKGQWNYWAFTKNVSTGQMKIYLNGVLWSTGTGKVKRMKGIKTFRIGQGNWAGSKTYEGKIDEFAVFNKELNLSAIQAAMNRKIDASHPNFNNLAVYYHFDDGNYQSAADAAPGGNTSATLNSVDNSLKNASDLVSYFSQSTLRPNVKFEQGVYTSHLDSVLVVDSTILAPNQIITYNDSINNPGTVTATYNVWPAYYNNYVYDVLGQAIDSSFVAPDSTLYLSYYDYYKKFPQIVRYELARYITPYGNSLSLGTGWTWTFDVSDYRTLLADTVHLSAGNWQELLDVKFLMIKGIPPRDPISVKNLWNGGFNYGQATDPIDNHLPALNINIPNNALNTRWKSRITGHGMDSPQNCAEFCAKTHSFKVNGAPQFSKLVWRDNCDLNPLYPQGGTWVYDRANWCPGAEVWTYDWELTPHISPGTSVSLDHDVQAYTNTGDWDYYQIEDQLVSYGAPNFILDAAVEDILSPSKDQMYLRYNPVCTNPVIRIKNTGSTNLTSLTITYGLNGAASSVFNWTGNLKFTEIEEVRLGTFSWVNGATDFNVTISNPNGGTDQYTNNNSKSTKYVYPLTMPAQFVIEYKTNAWQTENSYTLKDDAGNTIFARIGTNLLPNTLYRDTMSLMSGCYTFEMTDTGEDGLSWWANSAQGAGYIRFKKVTPATILKNFGADFGGQIYQQFTIGLTTGGDDYIFTEKAILNVYPNPSSGHVNINVDLPEKKDGRIEIHDVLGKKVYEYEFKNLTAESIEVDLSFLKKGVYFVTLNSGREFVSKKLAMH